MNKNNKTLKFTSLLFIIIFTISKNIAKAYSKETILSDIAQQHLRSFQSEEIASRKTSDANKKQDFDIKNIRPPKLTTHKERELIFSVLFAKSNGLIESLKNIDLVLNDLSWTDLKILFGSPSSPELTLVQKINKTKSVAGECALAILLTTPSKKLSEILYRQSIVKWFYNNQNVRTQVRSVLTTYSEVENSFLSLYTNTDPLYTKEYIRHMESLFYSKYGHKDNKKAGLLQLKKVFFRDIFDIHIQIFSPFLKAGVTHIFKSKKSLDEKRNYGGLAVKIANLDDKEDDEKSITEREYIWMSSIPLYGFYYNWKYDQVGEIFGFLKAAVLELGYAYTVYNAISNYLTNDRTIRELAARMYDVQIFLKTIEKIKNAVDSTPELKELYGFNIENIRKLLAKSGDGSELGEMIDYLMKLPLNNWNYFFSNAGKLLAAHTIFIEQSKIFADAIYELGLIDAYCGVAEVVYESESNEKNKYCFANFVDPKNRTKPFLDIKDMWNPFINPEKSVPNTILMGEDVSHVILTGPNAGGKSTFLTGVADSIVLAQAFGIAPAKSLIMTPFAKINTYIDRTDDIAAGNSLFMVEAKRAHTHINVIKSLAPEEFAFSIFDEPFSGTNPTEGAAAEYSILESLANYKNSLNIVATHYPIVMLLEERVPEKGFANYKVYIKEGTSDLIYTYKVVRGKSTQAIAIRILEEEGFDTEMLKVAKDIIANPKKYAASF